MPALLAHEGTAVIHCRECGNPVPLQLGSGDETPGPDLTLVIDGAALRAHRLLTHGIEAD